MAATTDTRQTLAGREDLERFASLAGATPGEIERGFMACEAAGLEPGWYTAARVAGSRHHRFVEMLTGAGHTAEETAAGYVDRLAHNAHPDRAGHQEWVSRVNHRWSAAVERGHDLVDAQLLAAPAPGEASRDRHEQVVYAHLSDRQGTHWFVCELDHTTGTAGVWEWPVGADSEPGWRNPASSWCPATNAGNPRAPPGAASMHTESRRTCSSRWPRNSATRQAEVRPLRSTLGSHAGSPTPMPSRRVRGPRFGTGAPTS